MSSSKNLVGVRRTNTFITKSSFLSWKKGMFLENCCLMMLRMPDLWDLGKSLTTPRMAKVFVYSCLIMFLSFLTSLPSMPCASANWRTISIFLFISFSVSVCSVSIAVMWASIQDQAITPHNIQKKVNMVSAVLVGVTSPYPTVVRVCRLHYKETAYTSHVYTSPKSRCPY